jgi:hypothetical protein
MEYCNLAADDLKLSETGNHSFPPSIVFQTPVDQNSRSRVVSMSCYG